MYRLFFLLLICLLADKSGAQPKPAPQTPLGIAYYDVDHLYDTLPSRFYNDTAYTPAGRLHWNTERYQTKINHTAAVIDSLGLPIIALWGVENEAVVRDLVGSCQGDYTYLHRTLNSLDGMDFALLYYGDFLYPEFVEEGRRYLYIEGELKDHGKVGFLLCADPHMARWVVPEIRKEHPAAKLIVMGRTEGFKGKDNHLVDESLREEGLGRGNIRTGNRWVMRDRIWTDTALESSEATVYIRRYLVDQKAGKPLQTYYGGVYRGGYGFSLPIYIYLQ